MNYIYLMKDEKKNHALFKAGFAKDIATRVYAYTSHNPEVQCISTIRTMDNTMKVTVMVIQPATEKRLLVTAQDHIVVTASGNMVRLPNN